MNNLNSNEEDLPEVVRGAQPSTPGVGGPRLKPVVVQLSATTHPTEAERKTKRKEKDKKKEKSSRKRSHSKSYSKSHSRSPKRGY